MKWIYPLIASLLLVNVAMAESKTERERPILAYPLKVCIISGEKLGSHGKPIVHMHGDREIKLCCRQCLKKFTSNPQKYIAAIDKAAIDEAPATDSSHTDQKPHAHH
ncbi:MAG TPA: hypothetical protein PKE12_04595 [Kiritimatiellia bacterium]|nr:hypothetical protein [Kiritimatiellia bacterium]